MDLLRKHWARQEKRGSYKLNLKELPKPVEIKKFLDQYVIRTG
jgi:ATP-dependent protease Clp ATPase subunit